jgi:hypothetical protein
MKKGPQLASMRRGFAWRAGGTHEVRSIRTQNSLRGLSGGNKEDELRSMSRRNEQARFGGPNGI